MRLSNVLPDIPGRQANTDRLFDTSVNGSIFRHMIISHQRRAIFFHNPKCAGTSVRRALQPFHDDPVRFRGIQAVPFLMNDMDHSHLRLWELQLLYPHIMEAARSYRSAILVRNPYHRFISAVDEHYKVFQPSVPFAAMTPEQQTETVETFLERGLRVS